MLSMGVAGVLTGGTGLAIGAWARGTSEGGHGAGEGTDSDDLTWSWMLTWSSMATSPPPSVIAEMSLSSLTLSAAPLSSAVPLLSANSSSFLHGVSADW